MFVPPDRRHPGSSPWDHPAPTPPPPPRGGTVGLWLIGLLLVATVLAPMGGSSLLEALWYVMRR